MMRLTRGVECARFDEVAGVRCRMVMIKMKMDEGNDGLVTSVLNTC